MIKVTIDRALIEQALYVIDAWERDCDYSLYWRDRDDAMKALRAAIAEPAVAPVAYRSLLASGSYAYSNTADFFANAEPLFASPTPPAEQAPVPLLSDEELAVIVSEAERTYLSDMNGSWRKALMVATEQAVRRKAGL